MKIYTASEYLIEHIKIDQTKRAFTKREWNDIFETAIKLDKARIVSAFYAGGRFEPSWEKAEDYYKKTFDK